MVLFQRNALRYKIAISILYVKVFEWIAHLRYTLTTHLGVDQRIWVPPD